MSPSSRRTLGLLIAAIVFVAVGATAAWRIFDAHRQGWLGLTYMPRSQTAKSPNVPSPFGWTPGSVIVVFPGGPAERAGIKPRDVIDAIGGVPTNDWAGLERLDKRVRSGDRVVLRVIRDGAPRQVPLVLESVLRSPLIAGGAVTSVVVGLIYFFIGAFIFWRRPDDRRVTVFFAVTLIAYISFIGMPVLQTSNVRGIASPQTLSFLPPFLFIAVAALLFAPTLLHLALVFPKPRPIVARRPEIFRWIYSPVLLLVPAAFWSGAGAAAIAASRHGTPWKIAAACAAGGALLVMAGIVRIALRAWKESFREAVLRQPVWSTLVLEALLGTTLIVASRHGGLVTGVMVGIVAATVGCAAFAVYPVSTVITLYRSYRDSGIEERHQVKWPLWATIVAVGVKLVISVSVFLFNTTHVLQQKQFLAMGLMQVLDVVPKLLYILIPLSFAFAIAKYRLMDIDLIVRRTVTYGILSAIVFVMYGVLVAGVGTLLVRFAGMQNQAMVIASTIVVALVAVPLRNTLQRLVDRNVFRERVSYPLALRTVAEAVSGGIDRDELLRLFAEQLQQALQNRFVLVAMRSDQHFVATAKVGVADEILGNFRVPAAGVDLARPIDPERDPLPQQLSQRLGRLGTALVVPMRSERNAIGFVALGAKLSHEMFSAGDVEFLHAATTQVAMALETSRLRGEEADFDQARAMQLVLLPKSLPHIDGFALSGMWQPARSVGGDYYDAIALGDDKVAICIADVAGKGMSAALLMASVQAAVKATASPDMPPNRLCEKVRHVVAGNLSGGTFITFFYALLDARTRTLTYCNAGHNPPVLVRASGDVERLDAGGSVLGRLFRGETYEQAMLTLNAGDRVVLFTDGVSEARRAGEDFGDERLIDVVRSNRELSPADIQEKVVEAITTYTSGSFGDDVTMVVVGAM